jgi:glycosyltransferase involved in cell wall biosynthesis
MTSYKQFQDRLAGFLGDSSPVRSATRWLCGPGASVFSLHRVLPRGAQCFDVEMCTSEDAFSDFLDWLVENYQVVPLGEIAARREAATANAKRPYCALTFDDGWHDNFAYAFPHLKRRGLSATIFLPTRFIGTNRRFWQERLWLCLQELKNKEARREVIERVARRLPWFPPEQADRASYRFLRKWLLTRPGAEAEDFAARVAETAGLASAFSDRAFVNWDEVRQMRASGVQFGSHTLNHTLLPNASPKEAEKEVQESLEELRGRIGNDVPGFAYPWGAWGISSLDRVRHSGYEFAVTTKPGLVEKDSDPFLLPRFPVSDSVLGGGRGNFSGGKARLSFAKTMLIATTKKPILKNDGPAARRIKILFVIDLITEWEGGTERQLQLLIPLLDPKFFELKLVFLFESPELDAKTLPCPLRVVFPRSAKLPSFPVRVQKLAQVLREERPDVVQGFFIEGLMAGVLAGRIARVPQVIGSVRNAGHWRKTGHRMMMKAITPLAHRWQTNSRALWEFQTETEGVPAAKVEILPNGTDLSRFVPATPEERLATRRSLGWNEQGPICISVANLSKVKDLATLVNAAKLLHGRLRSLQFILVGEGPEREALQNLAARLGLSDVVKLVGRQSDVRRFLAAADLGVLTSRSEGSSNSVLEYMAMGLPSVVSDIPANRELTDEVVFVPGNANDLAEKIFRLWQDQPLRTRLSREYQEMAAEFSVEKLALRAQSYYSRILSQCP